MSEARTLKDMLCIAGEYADELGYPRGDEIDGLCFLIVRRAAEVARQWKPEVAGQWKYESHPRARDLIADAILADAGLKDE